MRIKEWVNINQHKKNVCQNYNFQTTIFTWLQLLKKINSDKKIVKVKKTYYFNSQGSILYRNKARLSEERIYYYDKAIFFCKNKVLMKLIRPGNTWLCTRISENINPIINLNRTQKKKKKKKKKNNTNKFPKKPQF